MYLLEFAGGFVIQVLEFHANSLNKSIKAYLTNCFNALSRMIVKKVMVKASEAVSGGKGMRVAFK